MRQGTFVALAFFSAYLVIAAGLENLYPFSTFPMYSDSAFDTGARLIVVDGEGIAREVTRYTDWRCPGPLHVETVMCPDGREAQPAAYLAEEATTYMERHSGTGEGAEPVSLVVRVWRLDADRGDFTRLDCPVVECAAVRR